MERYCDYESRVGEARARLMGNIDLNQRRPEDVEFLEEVIENCYETLANNVEPDDPRFDNKLASMQAAAELKTIITGSVDGIDYTSVYASMIVGDNVWLNARIIDSLMRKKKDVVEGQRNRYDGLQSSDGLTDDDKVFLAEYSYALNQMYALMFCMQINYDKASGDRAMDEHMDSFERPSDQELEVMEERTRSVEDVVERLIVGK